jgi:hypothetical protein
VTATTFQVLDLEVVLDLSKDVTVVALDVGVPGPPGKSADTVATDLVAGLRAQALVFHDVLTVNDPRPDAGMVIWLGGDSEPTFMGPRDLWAPATA